ncbi:MAG: divergent PAP2 family protein [Firmicutes bacterium]|jgi:acid phosphatase family membrane protein YuiD|nr:divergent PAP2 family protein [Bacillota bacterium]
MPKNAALLAPIVAWSTAQLLKFLLDAIIKRRPDFTRLVNAGGMPSAHSSLVSCMSIMIGRIYGWESPIFAIASVLSLVVLYDAAGVRQAAGKQAKVINRIVEDIYKGSRIPEGRLKELLGHTPFEVLMGVMLGTVIGFAWILR